MKMKIFSNFFIFTLLVFLTNQQTTELTDDYLDPADIAEFKLNQLKDEMLPKSTPQIEETTTPESLTDPPVTEQTEVVTETSEELITESVPTEPVFFNSTEVSTSTESTEPLTEEPVSSTKSSNKENRLNVIVQSGEFQEFIVQKSEDKSDIELIQVKSSKKMYQIEMIVDAQNRHIDFSQCAISMNDANDECLLSYIEILNSNFVLKIKRHLLPFDVKIKLRQIISGCDVISRLRDIDMDDQLPSLYHNSDHDCIYRIKNLDPIKVMFSLKVIKFPTHDDRICHASMHVQTTNNIGNKDEYITQAVFDSGDSLNQFKQGILVGSKHVLIKLINCFENNDPIEIKIDSVRRSVKEVKMTEMENKYYHRLDSSLITSPKMDSHLHFELDNKDSRNRINFKLGEYKTKMVCDETNKQSSSIITVYGINQFNQMYVKQFTPCKFDANIYELRGFRKVYVQLNREAFHPSLNKIPDNFVMEFNLKIVKKMYKSFTNEVGFFSSETELAGSDMRNLHIDFDIRAKQGSRIIVNITKYTNGKENENTACQDYFIVKLNRTTNKIDAQIEQNPIVCSFIEDVRIFSSPSNRFFMTFIFNEMKPNENEQAQPQIEFSYYSEPFCDNTYTRLRKDLISYSSLDSVQSNYLEENIDCVNTIKLKHTRRIILYKINWLNNQNNMVTKEETNNNYINGQSVCENSDSLIISNENPKYQGKSQNQFCMDNPFYSFISESNQLYLNFKRSQKPTHLIRPLIFDIGYFSYKYLYSEVDSFINIDFSTIIPESVGNNTRIDVLPFKIKLTNNQRYIYPVISECSTDIKSGLALIRTSQKSIPFKLQCQNQTYTVLSSSFDNEISIEFINVNLSELRQVKFMINYTLPFRVMSTPSGRFETNNFQHFYLNTNRESVEYNYEIKLDDSKMIRLSIEDLKNDFGISEFTILDANKGEILYEQNELIENFKINKKFTYLFSSNWIRIIFKHMKENNAKLSKYPYMRCSYTSESKVLSVNTNGEIYINNTLTRNIIPWLLIAPQDHIIVVKLLNYVSKDRGQLKFSLLGNGYSDNGIYYFNLHPSQSLDRETDIVVSKDNMLRVEYSSEGLNDIFKLEYSVHKKILTLPSGIIRNFYNNLTTPVLSVPKLTDQQWTIRAPYSKKIVLYSKFIDLLNETPCSKSYINFYEANSSLIESKCGHLDNKEAQDLESMTSIQSVSNELSIKFVTQNVPDVVYFNQPPQMEPYKGFLYFYAFQEQPGDCYFQIKKNIMCDYKNIAVVPWVLKGDTMPQHRMDDSDYEKYFCPLCYLNAKIPVQTEKKENKRAVLISPKIDRTKRNLKFIYRLKNSAVLSVKLMYEKEYAEFDGTNFDMATTVKVFEDKDNLWKIGRVKIGSFDDFRLMFVLEQVGDDVKPGEASLDNIEFFEQDYDCSLHVDSTCPAQNEGSQVTKKSECHKYLTPCEFNKCKNDAICINKFNETENTERYECLCTYGYTGKYCETPINPCEISNFNKCSANSVCVPSEDLLMEYTCECKDGYHGKYCDKKFEPCKQLENPCNQKTGQGLCVDSGNLENPKNYTCSCSPMYTGVNCEFIIEDKCLNSQCNKYDPKAVCIELEDRFVCKCSNGFDGPDCQNIDDCASSPCQNNGTCVDGINSFKCVCDERFEGKYCEESKVCGLCDAKGTLFCNEECVCRETHEGDFCENEIDPCQSHPCNHGDCISNKIDGNFECLCHYGWKGKTCDRKSDLCDLNPCQNEGICIPELDHETEKMGYFCKCQEGFSGKNCEIMVDFCEDRNQCKNGGTCISGINNFTCACPLGYTGKHCETKIDNCAGATCLHGSTCISVLNGYICKCPTGYYGRYCDEEGDKCIKNECQNGRCIPNELDNNYRCNCMPGYTGKYCEINIDDCESNPCQNGARCVDLLSSYKCICPQNYTGKNCENTFSYCSLPETSCSHTNTKRCIPIPGGNKCECLPRFTGLKCETQIDYCDYYKPCRNGKCKSIGINDFICENCDAGFIGKNCSEMIDYCTPINPCKNGGTCMFEAKGYFCKCQDGYTGKNCEEKISISCLYHKCRHNSVCVPTDSGYRCECDAKYEGKYCEHKKKDLCKDEPCDGYCVNGKCECDPRIIFCKKNSQCHDIKCMNGGTCIDVIRGDNTNGMCICPPGIIGKFCEQSIFCNSTRTLPCGSTSQCATVNSTYECHCDKPFIGHGCNKKLVDELPKFNQFMQTEKLMNEKTNCKFGKSKESKILIGIIIVAFVICLVMGILIGHFSILSYKKKFESSKMSRNTSRFSEFSANDSMNFMPKTPLMKNRAANEITLQKSAGGFSIPRPSVRL